MIGCILQDRCHHPLPPTLLIASTALIVKLRTTCCSCTRSARTAGDGSANFVSTDTRLFRQLATRQLKHVADRSIDVHPLLLRQRLLETAVELVDHRTASIDVAL